MRFSSTVAVAVLLSASVLAVPAGSDKGSTKPSAFKQFFTKLFTSKSEAEELDLALIKPEPTPFSKLPPNVPMTLKSCGAVAVGLSKTLATDGSWSASKPYWDILMNDETIQATFSPENWNTFQTCNSNLPKVLEPLYALYGSAKKETFIGNIMRCFTSACSMRYTPVGSWKESDGKDFIPQAQATLYACLCGAYRDHKHLKNEGSNRCTVLTDNKDVLSCTASRILPLVQ
jgi:hypothetical protein